MNATSQRGGLADMEPVDASADTLASNTKAVFLAKVRQSNVACQNGDYERAIQLYTDAIALDPANHILYSNRSAAFIKVGQYGWALQDAVKAQELHPKWAKAYYRQGVALQCQDRHADALAAFSSGLAQEPKSLQLLAGLVEAAMKSPLRATLEPTYRQLQSMHLDKSPFVIISVIGQELLATGHYAAAVVVLESALHIGTCSLKLQGSVFSALSSSYWALNSLDKAINYMQKDLAITKSLGDIAGECRAHGNLGSAYFSKGNFKEALTSHRYQLVLAMKCKDTQAAAGALTSLGHVYTAIGDYVNALASHKQCVQLVKQIGDGLQESREIGNVGAVYLAMGDFESAVECHMEHLRLATHLGNKVEEARAYSNLGSSHHFKRNFEKAIAYHERVLQLARDLGDKSIEARAYAGLGHAARCLGDYNQAKRWHERQLDTALSTRDKVGEGRACSNLGIVYQLLGDHDAAQKLHQAHLSIAKALHDRAGMGRAYGNMGNAHSAMGHYEQAIKYHKQELTISKEVNDRSSEASTHGNLAVAYQALSMCEMALLHYHSHLNIARELKDTAGEACALLNMANCYSSCGNFAQAVPYYESHLMLSQELQDVEGEARACHFLGYAHYCLCNFKEAIRYYNQDLSLAKDLQDSMSIGRAHCNLGLAHLALNNYSSALECQKYFLAIAHMMKHVQGKFRALGNIGDVLMKMKNTDEAIRVYQKQLQLAKQSREKPLEAGAYGALGLVFRTLRCYDKALGYHTQELTLRQETNDVRGECKAHGHLGAVHMSLGNYTNAIKCYEEQLERARELKDLALEAQAFGNLGIARLNMGHFEDAIGYFEQQLATLEQVAGPTALLDKGRSFGSLGECYDALGDFDEAIKCHEQYLTIAVNAKSLKDQDRAYRGLGTSHKCLGNLQQALVCFEKRLVVTHELNDPAAKATAYGELGQAHSLLGNYEQAISCLEHQLTITRGLKDRAAEADAVCGLGTVYQQMGEYRMALRYHQMDLAIAEETGNMASQGRAFGNLGVGHECLGNYEQAIRYQEQHLSIAAQVGDSVAKTLAFSSLGRIHHALSNLGQAVSYLQQGLQIAETIGRREDEAKIRHRLGLALWGNGDLEGAQLQLYRAADLFEGIRRECHGSTDYRLSLFDLQTASYQALQRVLVGLGRQDEALVVAERGRTRAFVDLLLERQGGYGAGCGSIVKAKMDEPSLACIEHLMDIVNRQKAVVLYYSLAAGYLYTWLIIPNQGIVCFHECCVSDLDVDSSQSGDESSPAGGSLLEQYILNVREALGVEALTSNGIKAGPSETESEAGDVWGQHLEELGDKLNQEGDRSGFLRMVNRGHLFNSSSYSLSSLFSLGSWNGSITSSSVGRPGSSTRAKKPVWTGPACLRILYDLLLGPIEDQLPKSGLQKELVVVLEGDLYLVPFAVLRGNNGTDYLCERFDLLVVPSISALKKVSSRSSRSQKACLGRAAAAAAADSNASSPTALVVGNPKLSAAVTDQWGWGDIPYAEQEAECVAEILGVSAVCSANAVKEAVVRELSQVECIHFATHVSWKLSAIVLSPGEYIGGGGKAGSVASFVMKRTFAGGGGGSGSVHAGSSASDAAAAVAGGGDADDQSEVASTIDLPSLSEFLLTAADILNLRLAAKLVVISSCHTRNHHGRAHSDGVVGLTRALLAAGAQCVLVSLWPVPDTAVKILFRTFYSSLLQGSRVSRALSEAMQTVQNTKHFAHPANWGGFLLVGADIKISSKVALMGQALCELLKTPDTCRDALRVVLHLVEKSLQRIHWKQKNAMYTTQKSIENKVGSAIGWKDLLMSVGFRFEPAANGIPASVFFPQSDPGERLTQCSASLQALLGLSSGSLNSLSKLLCSPEAADDVITLVRQVIAHMNMKDGEMDSVEIPIGVKLWRVHGCHELLASLGFDLMDVGQDEVTLRAGKQASKRQVQFVMQALLALFDTQEAPRSLGLDESSSTESLNSCEDSPGTDSPPLPAAPMYMGHLDRMVPGIMMGSRMGAFSTYVRNRGEPDGRTTASSDGQQQQHGGTKGRQNDAFTPSPIERPPYPVLQQRASSSSSSSNVTLSGFRYGTSRLTARDWGSTAAAETKPDVVQPAARMSLTLAHQTKIKALYPELPECPFSLQDSNQSSTLESSSSASSVCNWESGQSTVRRQVLPKERADTAGVVNGDFGSAGGVGSNVAAGGRHALANNVTSPGSSGFESQNSDSSSDFDTVRRSNVNADAGAAAAGGEASRSSRIHHDGFASASSLMATLQASHLEKLAVRVEVDKNFSDGCQTLVNRRAKNSANGSSAAHDVSGVFRHGASSGDAAVLVQSRGISMTLPHGNRSSRALSTLETKLNSSFGRPQLQRPRRKFGDGDFYSTIRDGDDDVGVAAAEAQGTCLGPSSSIQSHLRAAQLSRLDREVPISDVYHDRSVGLDLAPSLSKLLVAVSDAGDRKAPPPMSQATVDAVWSNLDLNFPDEGMSSFVKSLYSSDAFDGSDNGKGSSCSEAPVKSKPPPPPVPTKQGNPAGGGGGWLMAPSGGGVRKNPCLPPSNAGAKRKSPPPPPPPPLPRPRTRPSPPPKPRNLHAFARDAVATGPSSMHGGGGGDGGGGGGRHATRDEGDGHSMTESHYSGPMYSTDAEPRGTDIQSAYSSFTLYKPHRDRTKKKVWEAVPSGSGSGGGGTSAAAAFAGMGMMSGGGGGVANGSGGGGADGAPPLPMPRSGFDGTRPALSSASYATIAPTYETLGSETIDDDELEVVSVMSHHSCESAKNYAGRMAAGSGHSKKSTGVPCRKELNSEAHGADDRCYKTTDPAAVSAGDGLRARLSKQVPSWTKARPSRNLLQTSS